MKQIIMYLRISKEDEDIKDESNSIVSQRAMLREYIAGDEELSAMKLTEISDDGYSGTNMNRPGMQRLLEMVRAEQVECIIVKDMSRFARNYLETGKYLEQIFPFMGVRFIAVNDGYDSREHTGGIGEIDVQFKALIYDIYSRELSEKVKASNEILRSSGRHLSRCPSYGYKRPEDDYAGIIVDEEAADVVKRIFAMRLSGTSVSGIARILNAEGVDTPAIYHKKKRGGDFAMIGDKPIWRADTVSSILRNETYAGTMVYGRFEVREMGSRRPVRTDKKKWKRIPDHHEALVTMEDFEKVQAMTGRKFGTEKRKRGEEGSVSLRGKIYCGGCGHKMTYNFSIHPYFRCTSCFYHRKKENCVTSVRADMLEKMVLSELEKYLLSVKETDTLREKQSRMEEEQKSRLHKEMQGLEHTKVRLEEELREAYEAYAKTQISREEYIAIKENQEVLLAELVKKTEKKTKEYESLLKEQQSHRESLKIIASEIHLEKMTKDIADTFVDCITVNRNNLINIRWKFSERR